MSLGRGLNRVAEQSIPCLPGALVIASLSAGAVAYGAPIDLGGANPPTAVLYATKSGASSVGESLDVQVSDDNLNWISAPLYTSQAVSKTSGTSGSLATNGVAIARYMRVVFTNGSSAQPASARCLYALVFGT